MPILAPYLCGNSLNYPLLRLSSAIKLSHRARSRRPPSIVDRVCIASVTCKSHRVCMYASADDVLSFQEFPVPLQSHRNLSRLLINRRMTVQVQNGALKIDYQSRGALNVTSDYCQSSYERRRLDFLPP